MIEVIAGDRVLTSAASQAPVPEDGKIATRPASERLYTENLVRQFLKSRLRWSIVGRSTREGRDREHWWPGI